MFDQSLHKVDDEKSSIILLFDSKLRIEKDLINNYQLDDESTMGWGFYNFSSFWFVVFEELYEFIFSCVCITHKQNNVIKIICYFKTSWQTTYECNYYQNYSYINSKAIQWNKSISSPIKTIVKVISWLHYLLGINALFQRN